MRSKSQKTAVALVTTMLLAATAATAQIPDAALGGRDPQTGVTSNAQQAGIDTIAGASVSHGGSAYQEAYGRAIDAYRGGRLNDAVKELQDIIRKDPKNADLQGLLGVIFLQQNKTADAIPHLEAAVKARPADGAMRSNLGGAYLQTGQYDQAAAQFQAVLAKTPKDAQAASGLGIALAQSGHNAEAADALRRAVALRPTANDYLNLGTVLQKGGKTAEAAQAFAQAAALDPHNAAAWLDAGLLYAQTGDSAQAIPALQKAAALSPTDSYSAHLTLAQVYAKAGRNPEAITELTAASQQRPTEFEPFYNLGVLQQQTGHPAEAATAFRKALAIRPDDAQTQAALKALEPGGKS